MTPFEQGYHSFMKLAEGEGPSPEALMGGGAALTAGGLGASQAASYVPQPTAAGRQGMEALMGIDVPDYQNMNPDEARRLVKQYTESGHQLMVDDVLELKGGNTMRGRDFIEKLRTGPAGGLADLAGMPAWTPDTDDYYTRHYNAFTKSPQAAFEQLLEESDHADARKFLGKVDDVAAVSDDVAKRMGQETIKKLTNYRKLIPPMETVMDAAPRVGKAGRGAALLGLGAAGLGAVNKLRED